MTLHTHLVEGLSLTFRVFQHSISNIFMKHPVLQSYPHNRCGSNRISSRFLIKLNKIGRKADNTRAPSVESKNFISQVDNFPTLGIGKLRPACWSRPLRYVLRPKLPIQFGL